MGGGHDLTLYCGDLISFDNHDMFLGRCPSFRADSSQRKCDESMRMTFVAFSGSVYGSCHDILSGDLIALSPAGYFVEPARERSVKPIAAAALHAKTGLIEQIDSPNAVELSTLIGRSGPCSDGFDAVRRMPGF